MPPMRYVLTLSFANRPGIVAEVSTALFEGGFNILDAQQFDDTETGTSSCASRSTTGTPGRTPPRCAHASRAIAANFGMTWSMRAARRAQAGRADGVALRPLPRRSSLPLAQRRNADGVVAIIANYPRETYAHIDFDGIPFHYLPVTKETKMEQEASSGRLCATSQAEVVVLARYMQILSDGSPPSSAGAASTSTIRSCPASRARSRTIRRTRAA